LPAAVGGPQPRRPPGPGTAESWPGREWTKAVRALQCGAEDRVLRGKARGDLRLGSAGSGLAAVAMKVRGDISAPYEAESVYASTGERVLSVASARVVAGPATAPRRSMADPT